MKRYTSLLLAAVTVLLFSTGFYLREANTASLEILPVMSQGDEVPKSYSNIFYHEAGKLYCEHPETKVKYYEQDTPGFRYREFQINPVGYKLGITFDFNVPGLNGTIDYGLIKEEGVNFPQPVYFRSPSSSAKGMPSFPLPHCVANMILQTGLRPEMPFWATASCMRMDNDIRQPSADEGKGGPLKPT